MDNPKMIVVMFTNLAIDIWCATFLGKPWLLRDTKESIGPRSPSMAQAQTAKRGSPSLNPVPSEGISDICIMCTYIYIHTHVSTYIDLSRYSHFSGSCVCCTSFYISMSGVKHIFAIGSLAQKRGAEMEMIHGFHRRIHWFLPAKIVM